MNHKRCHWILFDQILTKQMLIDIEDIGDSNK